MLRIHVESNPMDSTSCIDPIDPVKVNYISRVSQHARLSSDIQPFITRPTSTPTQNPKPAHRSIPVGVTTWDQSPKLPVFVFWVGVEVGGEKAKPSR